MARWSAKASNEYYWQSKMLFEDKKFFFFLSTLDMVPIRLLIFVWNNNKKQYALIFSFMKV